MLPTSMLKLVGAGERAKALERIGKVRITRNLMPCRSKGKTHICDLTPYLQLRSAERKRTEEEKEVQRRRKRNKGGGVGWREARKKEIKIN